MNRRRSSSSVTLVLVGASAMTACGQSPSPTETMRRDMYASKADCVQDWGADPAKCEPRQTRSGSSSYTHYYGPAYSHGTYGSSRNSLSDGATSEARPGSRAMGTAHVSRSGFGSSSSSHASSGHSSSSSSGS